MNLGQRERKSCSGLEGELCVVFLKEFEGKSE